jgi:hypothetical protein
MKLAPTTTEIHKPPFALGGASLRAAARGAPAAVGLDGNRTVRARYASHTSNATPSATPNAKPKTDSR